MPRDRARSRAHAAAATAAVLAVLVAGCTAQSPVAPVTASPGDVPVLQPGRPGEPNTTLTGPAATPVTTPTGLPTDIAFLQDMIAHHAQAIVMVDSVQRFSDPQVASLASRIRDEQGPEIWAMAQRLQGWGAEVPPEATNPRLADHGSHAGMPGMATAAQLEELARARGTDADRLFLGLMIAHHEGALAMVDDHADNPADPQVEELAAEITATQSKQVAQMHDMLERLT